MDVSHFVSAFLSMRMPFFLLVCVHLTGTLYSCNPWLCAPSTPRVPCFPLALWGCAAVRLAWRAQLRLRARPGPPVCVPRSAAQRPAWLFWDRQGGGHSECPHHTALASEQVTALT